MKTKRYRKQRQTPLVRQQQTLYYAAAGIAAAMIIGVITFFYLNTLSDDTYAAPQPPDYSIATGFWSDDAIWNSGTSPGTTTRGSIEIFKNVTSLNSITFDQTGITLTITDTLVIHGSLEMRNNSDLKIGSGAVLVVTGDLIAGNTLAVESGGIIAVGGDADFGNSFSYSGTSSSELFVFNDIDPEDPSDFPAKSDPSDLQTRFPQIYDIIYGTTTTLPITLLDFTVRVQDAQVIVAWSTENETNNDYFSVERSVDGQQYEVVGTIDGAGTSTFVLTYSWTDEQPLAGVSYYRLRQTDFDGQQEAFDWVAVSVEDLPAPPESLTIDRVFPNPFDAACSVAFTRADDTPVTAQLMDMQGNVVASQQVQGYQSQLTLSNLQGLRPGTYLIRLVAGTTVSPVQRVIKK